MPSDDSQTGGPQCPEHDCELVFNTKTEVMAHLQWDHNRSESEAEAMLDAE